MCATEFVTSYFVIVQGRMSTVNNYCHTSTSIAVMSATASDSEEYGANDEPQAAICSVMLVNCFSAIKKQEATDFE